MKPYLSIILEKVDEHVPVLPLMLIDLDHHLAKLEVPYEVLIVTKNKQNHGIANGFAKLIKKNVFIIFAEKISAEDIKGEACLVFRNNFIPEFKSFKNLVESLNSIVNTDGYELVFGAIKDVSSGSGVFDHLGHVLGSPINLSFNHPVIGFTKNVAPSVLAIIQSNDIKLAMMANKLGFVVGEIPVRFRSGEGQMATAEKKIDLLFELIKIKLLGMALVGRAQHAEI